MNSSQIKKLRGLAHHLDPVVYIGQKGVTAEVVAATDVALAAHELIKVKFGDFKENRKELSAELAQKTQSTIAGQIGNITILYKQNPDSKKRKITL